MPFGHYLPFASENFPVTHVYDSTDSRIAANLKLQTVFRHSDALAGKLGLNGLIGKRVGPTVSLADIAIQMQINRLFRYRRDH